MGLILCRKEPVRQPYYIESLGLSIYSSQELCYVIYHYPLLAMDNFINDFLVQFIKEELDFGVLAMKVERAMLSGEEIENLLLMILQECDYLSTKEINQFQKKLRALQMMNPADYAKAKADDLLERKQYGKALIQYQLLLNNKGEYYERRVWRGEVWNNLGVVYSRLFQFDQAMEAFQHSYHYLQDESILRKMYFLTLIHDGLDLGVETEKIFSEEKVQEWQQEMEKIKEQARVSMDWQLLRESFRKDSKQKKIQTEQLLEGWKKQYRQMI